jgi:hypothetical protein
VLCLLRFRRRPWSTLLLAGGAAGVGLGLGAMTGCGRVSPALQPVTSTVTVTAVAGPLEHAASFSLTLN